TSCEVNSSGMLLASWALNVVGTEFWPDCLHLHALPASAATGGRDALRNRAASSTLPGRVDRDPAVAGRDRTRHGPQSRADHGVAHGEPRPGAGREGPRPRSGHHCRGRCRRELTANPRTAARAAAPGAAVSHAAPML